MSHYPQAFIDYLIHFHAERDFFECHEVLEEYWKEHPDDPLNKAYVGCIQVAVSMYHQRRGNLAGAVKLLRNALGNLTDEDMHRLGIEAAAFRERLQERLRELNKPDFQYRDLNIPLADPDLLSLCRERCAATNLTWQCPSNFDDTYLINKHTLRDRSGVIAERERSRHAKTAARKVRE
ncbi:DUF309 domain-containing protein [Paenibacillus xerothermodurans]|uniref:DUF309 domain-containing protein n=1 Tax=Paenibacillus xerothermodurans TaxID=1977292 RepID=A0A2W1NE26_PAEXE|nr:DUF309 domain-containing protein [Paenibacillus xerothermodurans]PZE21870.1 DUF309 domain-containing protein [Paenibacillus xerothermodurans]